MNCEYYEKQTPQECTGTRCSIELKLKKANGQNGKTFRLSRRPTLTKGGTQMLKELMRLSVVCLKIAIVMLALRGVFTIVHDPLDTVPTCRGHGYGGFYQIHMNEKTTILSIRCTKGAAKREKQK